MVSSHWAIPFIILKIIQFWYDVYKLVFFLCMAFVHHPIDGQLSSSLETDHCRSGFWEDDQGRDSIDTTQLCLGMGGGSEMVGRSIKEHMEWKGFQTRTFCTGLFCKGSCICGYLFDPVCLVDVESFKGQGALVFVYPGESSRDSYLARWVQCGHEEGRSFAGVSLVETFHCTRWASTGYK